jgi:hypothetical protein
MGCGCGQAKRIAYEVRLKDGSTQTVDTSQQAIAAIRAAGGGTYKPVKKT